jgi:hypothetical protein
MTYKVYWSEPKKFQEGNLNIDLIGVYLIGYRDTATNKRSVVYIGKGHIGDRLVYQYHNNPCIRKKIRIAGRVGYYRFSECDDENARLDAELSLYRKYGGSEKLCNKIEPGGSGRFREIEVVEDFPRVPDPSKRATV